MGFRCNHRCPFKREVKGGLHRRRHMIPQARRSNATCGDGVGRGHTPRNAMDASLEPGKGKKTESFFSRASEGKRPLNTLISACGNSFCISDPPPPANCKRIRTCCFRLQFAAMCRSSQRKLTQKL